MGTSPQCKVPVEASPALIYVHAEGQACSGLVMQRFSEGYVAVNQEVVTEYMSPLVDCG